MGGAYRDVILLRRTSGCWQAAEVAVGELQGTYHAWPGKLSWAEAFGLGMKETDQMQSLEGSGAERSVGTQTGSMTGECGGLLSRPAPLLALCTLARVSLQLRILPVLCLRTAQHPPCSMSPSRPASLLLPPPPTHTHILHLPDTLPALWLTATPVCPAVPGLLARRASRTLCCPGFIGRVLSCTGGWLHLESVSRSWRAWNCALANSPPVIPPSSFALWLKINHVPTIALLAMPGSRGVGVGTLLLGYIREEPLSYWLIDYFQSLCISFTILPVGWAGEKKSTQLWKVPPEVTESEVVATLAKEAFILLPARPSAAHS